MAKFKKEDSLIFSCSGCSDAGNAAYQVALSLYDEGVVEMSCLAGVAAKKPSFLRKLKGKKVIVVDGCPVECAKGIFKNQNIPIHQHIQLRDYGMKKRHTGKDLKEEEVSEILRKIKLI